jgi:hypothetical protein
MLILSQALHSKYGRFHCYYLCIKNILMVMGLSAVAELTDVAVSLKLSAMLPGIH